MSTGDEILLLRSSEHSLPSLHIGTDTKPIFGATDQGQQQQFGVAFDALKEVRVREADVFQAGVHVSGTLAINQPGQREAVDEAF